MLNTIALSMVFGMFLLSSVMAMFFTPSPGPLPSGGSSYSQPMPTGSPTPGDPVEMPSPTQSPTPMMPGHPTPSPTA